MDLEHAFLDDIVANPDDPTLWLIFADWLEERDDPRTELVRLWQGLRLEPDHPNFEARHARLEDLFGEELRLPLPTYTNDLGMEFVWVPPGRCWMGGGKGQAGKKRPTLLREPFYLGVYLVTQGQWRTLMGNNPSSYMRGGSGADRVSDVSDADLERFPVENVSWNDVQEFLVALNARDTQPGWVYRLPTNDEWEHAVRAPVFRRADCMYSYYVDRPTNDLTKDLANYSGNVGRTSKVGSYRPNRLGIYDLHGNVWEWMTTGGDVRGGGWSREPECCAAWYRIAFTNGYRISNLGFRVARVPAES
jgi:uncharacterized protein (TIGR02996 family)